VKLLVACERVDATGGTETYLRALLPALVRNGHDVRAIGRTADVPDAYGVPAQALHWSDEHDRPSADAAARAAAIALDFSPDVVAVHNVLDAAVLEALGTHAARLAYHLHDHRPFCPNGDRLYPQGGGVCDVAMGTSTCGWHALVNGCAYGPRRRTFGLIASRRRVARAVAAADATIALSRYVAGLAERNGIARELLHVAEPPLPDGALAATPASRPPRDAVLFAGRMMPSKGGRSLVRALARLPQTRRPLLRIAGEGPDLPAILGDAQAAGVGTQTLGVLHPAALRAAYDDATLVAMPSLWGEPFGLVGIEAFARARPVAAYDAGAIGEWLGNGAGHAVTRGDEAALANAIAELLEPAAWRTASARAFETARRYSLEGHVERIEAIYRSCAT
jgi:glycosyltransferase involved in cell wall biosynthesis